MFFGAEGPIEPGPFLELAWIIPLIMAGSFVLTLFVGKRLLGRNVHIIGISAIAVCFVLAIGANINWFSYVNDTEHAAELEAESHGDEADHGDDADTHADEDDDHATEAGDDHATEGDEEHGLIGPVGSLADGENAGVAARAPPVLTAEEEGHGVEYTVEPVRKSFTWWENGTQDFQVGMLLDGMAVMMLFVVTLISLLVHVFSTDYVGGDRRYTHYFAFLSLFSASMLGFVMAENTLQLITMWELVGVCSFALIGHWWEEKPNTDAAMKAFLTNRVGDVGLLVGMITLFFAAGNTFDIVEINTLANEGSISHTALLVSSLCLLAAVMSKSGQFILHTWLPDAMAGPTPVSALIHAATMVVAGVYMVARMYGVFWNGLVIGGSSVNALAVVGGVTVIGGASLAFVQNDIKKVLAYSTVSQLGYMVMALGVGAWTAALFHLFTHAMFKAGLFLGSGSVAHAVHSFDMKKDMGGMYKFMPKTAWTFFICTGALIGLFPLAGFWSKDEILAGASQLGGDGNYTAFLVVGTIGAFMTAAYMTRCIYLTFFGEFRGGHHDDHATAAAHDEDDAHDVHDAHHGDPHESGPRILIPLYVLSFMAVVAGLTNIPDSSTFIVSQLGDIFGTLRFEHFYEPRAAYFPSLTDVGPTGVTFAHPKFDLGIALFSTVVGLTGIGLAYAFYFKGVGPHGLTRRSKAAKAGHTLLVNKYYLDHLYTGVIAGGTKGPVAAFANWTNTNILDGIVNGAGWVATRFGRVLYTQFDQKVVDGAVNLSGRSAESGGQVFRRMQTGKVQQYAAILFAGAVVLAGIFIVVI